LALAKHPRRASRAALVPSPADGTVDFPPRSAACRIAPYMTTFREPPFLVGKYLVSPLARLIPAEGFAPSVSIRSGAGRSTHDRVMRFVARFPTRASACRYAAEQGLAWLRSVHTTVDDGASAH
jgi:hypothetical protein